MATLKVYRTPIGFHDAYVAAASQKAALEAWGSEHNLFARGVAEIVTDPALTEEPLANPGKVIKRSRGTAAEQFAALPPDKPKAATKRAPAEPAATPARKAKSKPRPDRAKLDAAEAAAKSLKQRHDEARSAIDARIAALQADRGALLTAQKAEVGAVEEEVEAASAAYDKAMRAWRG